MAKAKNSLREEIGRVAGTADLELADHNWLLLNVHFEYVSGGEQGFGYNVDEEFIRSFMGVWCVRKLSDVIGKVALVSIDEDSDLIKKVNPLFQKDGRPFDIAAWCKRKQER